MACFADINVSQGSVATCARFDGMQYPFNCKFTKESCSDFLKNRLRFDRIMVMNLWPRFFGLSLMPRHLDFFSVSSFIMSASVLSITR